MYFWGYVSVELGVIGQIPLVQRYRGEDVSKCVCVWKYVCGRRDEGCERGGEREEGRGRVSGKVSKWEGNGMLSELKVAFTKLPIYLGRALFTDLELRRGIRHVTLSTIPLPATELAMYSEITEEAPVKAATLTVKLSLQGGSTVTSHGIL